MPLSHICLTCQHWGDEAYDRLANQSVPVQEYRTCNRIVDAANQAAVGAIVTDVAIVQDGENHEAWLVTAAEFGCTLWAERPYPQRPDRAEDEPCQRGTVGCSVDHRGNESCETW